MIRVRSIRETERTDNNEKRIPKEQKIKWQLRYGMTATYKYNTNEADYEIIIYCVREKYQIFIIFRFLMQQIYAIINSKSVFIVSQRFENSANVVFR